MQKRKPSTVIVADKSYFDISMRVDSGLHILDAIQTSLARIVTTPRVLDGLERQIDAVCRPPLNAIWRMTLFEMRKDYYSLLSVQYDLLKASEEIQAIGSMISRALRPFNQGVDQMELEVLSAAAWLRRNSDTEVIVVSDDSDVLLACHLLSSFLGLVPSVLSSFEVLRLSSGNQYVGEICDYFSMGVPVSRYDASDLSASPSEIDEIARKGFLSIHTVLGIHESTLRMTSRRRMSRNA